MTHCYLVWFVICVFANKAWEIYTFFSTFRIQWFDSIGWETGSASTWIPKGCFVCIHFDTSPSYSYQWGL